ncbi:MAG: excinuclease ABC subunit C [Flavobacterium sp. BFFFF1]|uniref:GIY-YIG nuclease family protein n=1 Tax=Flavobacterium sp. BFFFF1 TaxID=2015557 RepID=UPI000BCBB3C8|nr:GIY-YIG nuclease family protein [Flavobacterium sp. BFFFF1]OYU82179.1 MAG: excinuclease ABC subunit C [Flavobacterium sp. BFFFF1]
MHYLYIVYSKSADKYYVGETYDVAERLLKQNNHLYDNAFTKIAHDWRVVLEYECLNESHAAYLERFIKKMKSRTFILKIINSPEILNDISLKRK